MSDFKVEEMTCGHCEKTIRAALTKESPQVKVGVDLEHKIVKVENLADDRVVFLLEEVGYTAQKIKH
jgi:copper chaperone